MSGADPDRPLIERAQRELPYGTRAFDELLARHSRRVYARCYSILRSQADAEEASQDVFLSVFRALPRFRFEKPFVHWLSTITLNACRMVLRRREAERRRREALQREGVEPPPAPSGDAALRRVIVSLLDELEPGSRVALLMRFVEDHSYAEISQELGISESAAKMRVSRAARRLRELYEARVEAGAARPESDDE